MDIEQFVERHKVKLSYQSVPVNPHWTGTDKGAAHYYCTLTVGDRSMSLHFSKGSGLRVWRRPNFYAGEHSRPKGYEAGKRAPVPRCSGYDKEAYEKWSEPEAPTVAEVLDCLASDASSVDNVRSFEEWADELGMDQDSRSAEATYRECVAQANDLRKLLGSVDYDVLLREVERP